jgi:hypothetical protein
MYHKSAPLSWGLLLLLLLLLLLFSLSLKLMMGPYIAAGRL